MIKYFYYLLLSFALVYVQQTFLTNLDFISNLNLILVNLVFITIIFGFNLGFIFAVFIGFFLNFYSFLPLGTFVVIYLIIIVIVNFLHKNVLINFSFYTNSILIILSTILYSLLSIFFFFIFYLVHLVKIYINFDHYFLNDLLWQIIFNFILMSIVYLIAKITIKRLNLAFIFKK